jgi:hypothetical protein
MGSLAGVDSVDIRAQATDLVGNTSDWTAWRALTVDLAQPNVMLDSALEDALADGILGPDELLFVGSLQDETAALAVKLCLIEADRQTCTWLSTPGGSPTGNWQYDTSGFQSGDGISQTLTIRGLDVAGNVSSPISRTYTVDTVGPSITATQVLEQVALADYQPGSPAGPPVLSGAIYDGLGVASITVRLRQPDGSVISQTVSNAVDLQSDGGGIWPTYSAANGNWEYVPELTMPGSHSLTVEAVDLAGNVASHEAFTLIVEGTTDHFIYLPFVAAAP